MDRLEEARAITGTLRENDAGGAEYFVDLARLQVAVGEPREALRSLKRSFELTPPSRLEAHAARISACQAFDGFHATPEFVAVLKTPSTIKESPCSGGSGCSKCPKRAKCGSEKHAQKQKKP
jgi:hypothetical protein